MKYVSKKRSFLTTVFSDVIKNDVIRSENMCSQELSTKVIKAEVVPQSRSFVVPNETYEVIKIKPQDKSRRHIVKEEVLKDPTDKLFFNIAQTSRELDYLELMLLKSEYLLKFSKNTRKQSSEGKMTTLQYIEKIHEHRLNDQFCLLRNKAEFEFMDEKAKRDSGI